MITSCQESAVSVYVYNKLALLLGCSGKPDTESTANRSKIPGQLGLSEMLKISYFGSTGIILHVAMLRKRMRLSAAQLQLRR